MEQSKPPARWLVLFILGALWIVTIAGRLGWLQLVQYQSYLTRARRQQEHLVEISPERGVIYDRNGRELAISTPVESCFANPAEISDPAMVAGLLTHILDVPQPELETKLREKKYFVWIRRKLPPDIAERVGALNLRGVYLRPENQRYYPQGTLAAHALGYVNTDGAGLGGIEYELDSQIRGRPGRMLVLEDARGHWLDRRITPAMPGADVVLTLDQNIQFIAEKELTAEVALSHAKGGVVVVQNPANGEILALASAPTFDPNKAGNAPQDALMDRAVGAAYEPGSTFKLITLAGALQEGITNPDEVVDCQMGKIILAGRLIHDHKPFGLVSVAGILAKSSDIGAIKIGLRLGAPKFYQYIRAFGFGAPTGIELPGENAGLLRHVENWSGSSIGSLAMGQEISVNALQLISAVSAIANGGTLYRPRILKEIRGPNHGGIPVTQTLRRVLSASTAATVRNMMEGVILQGGTGKSAQLAGYSVAGKTGTAQKIDPATGRYSATQYIASFVGFAPVNNPPVTVLVVLDSPLGLHMGGDTAAPLFKRIMDQVLAYLGVPHDQPLSPQQEQYARQTGPAPPAEGDGLSASGNDDAAAQTAGPTIAGGNSSDVLPIGPHQAGGPLVATSPSGGLQTASFAEAAPVAAPNFAGRSVREVAETCMQLGLTPVLIGTGIASEQSPEAGTSIPPGGRITVHFSRTVPISLSSRQGGK
jgi:cell division protein FtsI (penicillin-binding protein 3)